MDSKKVAVSLEGGLDQLEGDPDGDVVMESGSEKKSDSETSDSKLSAFTLETGNVPKDNYSVK